MGGLYHQYARILICDRYNRAIECDDALTHLTVRIRPDGFFGNQRQLVGLTAHIFDFGQ